MFSSTVLYNRLKSHSPKLLPLPCARSLFCPPPLASPSLPPPAFSFSLSSLFTSLHFALLLPAPSFLFHHAHSHHPPRPTQYVFLFSGVSYRSAFNKSARTHTNTHCPQFLPQRFTGAGPLPEPLNFQQLTFPASPR